jgi:hypothetical protein
MPSECKGRLPACSSGSKMPVAKTWTMRSMLAAGLLGALALVQAESLADRFEAPVPVSVNGQVLEFHNQRAVPALGDFYGEGRKDLLIGQTKGRLLVFRNIGTDVRPEFEKPVWFDEIVPEGRMPTG